MYQAGNGVPQNYPEALKWFRKAADEGDAMAQAALGLMYHNGQGVPQDHAEALNTRMFEQTWMPVPVTIALIDSMRPAIGRCQHASADQRVELRILRLDQGSDQLVLRRISLADCCIHAREPNCGTGRVARPRLNAFRPKQLSDAIRE
jgi:hypothetical protein